MPVNQKLRVSPAALGLLAAAALLATSGCTFFRLRPSHEAPPAARSAAPAPVLATAAAAPAQTVTDNLPDVGEAETTTTAAPARSTTVVIADTAGVVAAGAPKSHVVQRGDTLWGLAGMFLKDPWAWPEIWYMNPEVSNPHRIYPGDTLRLALGRDGKEQLQLTHGAGGEMAAPVAVGGPVTRLNPLLRSQDLDGPIDTIPYGELAAFLSRPSLMSASDVKAAPYVLALRDNHLIAGAGTDIYVRKLTGAVGARYNVMHLAQPLKVAGHGTVGYLAQFSGVAEVSKAGDPARALLTESARETLSGDVLIPEASNLVTDIRPHRPTAKVDSRILAVVNGVLLAGQFQVVAISGGSGEGVEAGHVLKVLEATRGVTDRCARIEGTGTCRGFRDTMLPQETAGTLLVFRSFEHMSYALIANESVPLHIGDHAVAP
jgi:hypothetical protein